MKTTGRSVNVRKYVTLGVLAALSIVLVAIVHFPIFPILPPGESSGTAPRIFAPQVGG